MNTMTYEKPKSTGYYWLQPYDAITGLPNQCCEIVRVAFGFSYRRKTVNRVIGQFWQCNLEDVINAKWSAEILPPKFN